MNKQEERIYNKLMNILDSNLSEIHEIRNEEDYYNIVIYSSDGYWDGTSIKVEINFLNISIKIDESDEDGVFISRIFDHKQYEDLRYAIEHKLACKKSNKPSILDKIEDAVTLKEEGKNE